MKDIPAITVGLWRKRRVPLTLEDSRRCRGAGVWEGQEPWRAWRVSLFNPLLTGISAERQRDRQDRNSDRLIVSFGCSVTALGWNRLRRHWAACILSLLSKWSLVDDVITSWLQPPASPHHTLSQRCLLEDAGKNKATKWMTVTAKVKITEKKVKQATFWGGSQTPNENRWDGSRQSSRRSAKQNRRPPFSCGFNKDAPVWFRELASAQNRH